MQHLRMLWRSTIQIALLSVDRRFVMDDKAEQDMAALQRDVKRSLRSLEADLGAILNQDDSVESDAFLGQFEEQTAELDGLLQSMHSVLEVMHEVGSLNLTVAVQESLNQVLGETRSPIIVHTQWAEQIPYVVVAREPMLAALRRVLKVASEYCGVGGEMKVVTEYSGRNASMSITAERVGPQFETPNKEPVDSRCASVADFVRNIGGVFQVDVAREGTLHVLLQMELGVEAR